MVCIQLTNMELILSHKGISQQTESLAQQSMGQSPMITDMIINFRLKV